MSQYHSGEYSPEDLENYLFEDESILSQEQIEEIQERYMKKRLVESLIGPVISTIFHVLLIILLAIFITDEYKEQIAEIEVVLEDVEEVELEKPVIEEPEPEELETTETTEPVLTTVKIENVDTSDTALEDTSDHAPSTDDNMTEDAVSDVVISPSAFASPSVYGGRSASGRASAISRFGGSKLGQDALLKALWWLAKVQNPDGSWGTTQQPAFTGLALLTFLAHGETQTSKNFGTTVRKAMDWLIKDPVDPKSGKAYGHGIKTYALAEAYAMTGVSALEDAMNMNIRIIIDGQQDAGCYNYAYKRDPERQDLSVAGWNYQALKAAYGAGCEEKGLNEAIYKAIEWLKKNTTGKAQFPYSTKNNVPKTEGKTKHTMRAVGVLCLQLFGEGRTPEIKDDIKQISSEDLQNLSWANPPKESLYGWYYATQAMFQHGGAEWKNWNRKFQKEITGAQHPEGYWVYPGKFHGNGDDLTLKVYATTLCSLMLTVYYRYLPSSSGAIGDGLAGKDKKKVVVPDEEGLDLVD